MKKAGFDERLSSVLQEAAIRLVNRMKRAYFHGQLKEYLTGIGLADELEDELADGRFSEVCGQAEGVLETKIRRARQKGYLKDYLNHINMLDLLNPSRRIRGSNLRLVPGFKPREDMSSKQDDVVFLAPVLTVV